MNNKSIYEQVADRYRVKVYLVKRGDKFCKANGESEYVNRSYFSGRTIWVGIYTDQEKKLASFFHEVGHIIDPIEIWEANGDPIGVRHKIELWAWTIGFKLAESYGITFSANTKRWAKRQADTYLKYYK